MTREEAIECNKNLRMYMKLSDKNQPCKFLEENYIALDMAIKALEQEPKTGHWKRWEYSTRRCSECDCIVTHEYKFCPDCGAYMRGEK